MSQLDLEKIIGDSPRIKTSKLAKYVIAGVIAIGAGYSLYHRVYEPLGLATASSLGGLVLCKLLDNAV